MQHDWGQHHAGDAHESLAKHQCQQRQPNGRMDFDPMILLFRKYSNLWTSTKKAKAHNPLVGETMNPSATTRLLLMRLPITGRNPQRNVSPTATTNCGRPMATMKIAVRMVLTAEIVICALVTIAKLW